tara:strand:- start:3991 stop:4809 length:819 start_codon:yes stop_codon:yes gene_type:complete
MNDVLKVGVIGMGFVGSAVYGGFANGKTIGYAVDPKLGDQSVTYRELSQQGVDVVFLCLPTPSRPKLNDVDPTIVYNVLDDLRRNAFSGLVAIKSSVTPQHLKNMIDTYSDLRIVYNPEFLTEQNAERDFKNPFFQVIGGDWADCTQLQTIYRKYSQCASAPTFKTDVITASLVKYALNSFYATKVVFMNELHQLHEASGAETTWDEFIEILDTDPRMGSTHLNVPGPDGKYGFGGNCFPKDTKALMHYAFEMGIKLGVLESAVNRNVNLRK